jgi:hypothetical protein
MCARAHSVSASIFSNAIIYLSLFHHISFLLLRCFLFIRNHRQSLRNHCAINAKSSRNHCSIAAPSLSNRCASAAQSLRNRRAIATKALRNCCESGGQSLRNNYAVASRLLCTRRAIAVQLLLQSLLKCYKITAQSPHNHCEITA